ncbi:MAG: hypothetical protein ABIO71_09445 [Caldimonas sp.]
MPSVQVIEQHAAPVDAERIGPSITEHPELTAAAPTLQYGLNTRSPAAGEKVPS